MMHHVTSLTDGDSQSLHESGLFQDCAPKEQKNDPEETLLNLSKIPSHDIRSSLLSMLATLKLLNRGYYGKMDDEVADKIKNLLFSATRLTRIVDACLGETSAGGEEREMAGPNREREQGKPNKPNKQTSIETKIEPSTFKGI